MIGCMLCDEPAAVIWVNECMHAVTGPSNFCHWVPLCNIHYRYMEACPDLWDMKGQQFTLMRKEVLSLDKGMRIRGVHPSP